MASNDMNSWDKDPDERLRQDWQQAFAKFKVQSRPSLRKRILSRATAQHRPKPMDWLAGGILLLVISTVLVYTVRRSNRPASVQGRIVSIQPAPPSHTERIAARQPATPTRPATSSEQPKTDLRVKESVTGQPRMDHQPMVSSAKTAVAAGLSRDRMLPPNRLRLRAESKLPLTDSHRSGGSFTKSTHFSAIRFPIALSLSVGASHRQWAKGPVEKAGDGPGHPAIEAYAVSSQPANPASSVVFARLDTPTLSALPSSLRALPGQLPTNAFVIHPTNNAESRIRWGKQWFVEAVPLSSFQWMSASSTSTGYLTQVNALTAFSPATWGYQINGGLRWQHWQAYLSIGQLRRWAYYTVNENRYRMESSPTNSYQMVQEKQVVAENIALPLVGGGLSQYRLLGQGRYVVELGGQIAYSPMGGQILASLRGGVGRRLPISRRLALQAGLMAEYGLTRLMSEQKQLAIHPIVVGISVRIQPRLHSQER